MSLDHSISSQLEPSSFIGILLPELTEYILDYCSTYDKIQFLMTCRKFQAIVCNSQILGIRPLKDYGIKGITSKWVDEIRNYLVAKDNTLCLDFSSSMDVVDDQKRDLTLLERGIWKICETAKSISHFSTYGIHIIAFHKIASTKRCYNIEEILQFFKDFEIRGETNFKPLIKECLQIEGNNKKIKKNVEINVSIISDFEADLTDLKKLFPVNKSQNFNFELFRPKNTQWTYFFQNRMRTHFKWIEMRQRIPEHNERSLLHVRAYILGRTPEGEPPLKRRRLKK